MEPVVKFFKDIHTDINLINTRYDSKEEIRDLRIQSVIFRVLGAICSFVAAKALIAAAITTLTGGAILPTVAITSALFLAIIAHDCIVVGSNQSRALALLINPSRSDQTLLERGVNFIRNGADIAGKANQAFQKGTAVELQGTFLFEPFYMFMQNITNSNKGYTRVEIRI